MRIEGLSRMRKAICFLIGWNDWLKRSPDFKDGEKRVKANTKDGKKRAISELLISRCSRVLPLKTIRERILGQASGYRDWERVSVRNECAHGGNVLEDILLINEKRATERQRAEYWGRAFRNLYGCRTTTVEKHLPTAPPEIIQILNINANCSRSGSLTQIPRVRSFKVATIFWTSDCLAILLISSDIIHQAMTHTKRWLRITVLPRFAIPEKTARSFVGKGYAPRFQLFGNPNLVFIIPFFISLSAWRSLCKFSDILSIKYITTNLGSILLDIFTWIQSPPLAFNPHNIIKHVQIPILFLSM